MMHRRYLAAWYFAYFAFIGAFIPYFGLYLEAQGLPPSQIGVVLSLGQVVRMLMPALWGWLSDRSGQRLPIVRASALLSVLCFPAYFAVDHFLAYALATITLNLFWTGALPLVEALTFAHLRDDPERYGQIRLWGSIGFIVAVSGVGALLDWTSVNGVLWASWGVLWGVLLIAWQLAEAPTRPGEHQSQPFASWRAPHVIALLVAGFCMSAAHGPLYVFYSIHLADHGFGKWAIGLLWSLGVVAEILVFLWMPRWMRLWPLKTLLSVSFALAVLRFLMIGWLIDDVVWVVVAQLLHGATFGVHHAATVAALNRWFAPAQQGRMQALYGSASFGAGGMVGAVVSGMLWQSLGATATYTVAAGCALLGWLVVAMRLPRHSAEEMAVR